MFAPVLAAALAFTPSEARIAFETASNLVERCTPRDAGTFGGRRAAEFILDAASAVGADARLDRFTAATPCGLRTFANVECSFVSNPTGAWTVVVSHYDTKPGTGCPGANDGASTTGLLVALASTLRNRSSLPGNVLLVWTDGEESMKAYTDLDGFWGSRHAAEKLRKTGVPVRAVICVDMLGDRDLGISLPRNTDPELRRIALRAARGIGEERLVREVPELVKDDHVAFQNLGFPAIDLIDFAYGTEPGGNDLWHTPADTVDRISELSLLRSGRLLAAIMDALGDDSRF